MRQKRIKMGGFLAIVCLSLAMVVGLVGCVPAPVAPTTLTIIMEEVPDTDVVKELIPQFEAENPWLRITIEALPYAAMRDKMLTSFLAPESIYDIVIADNPWMDEFASAGFLEPLDERIAQTPDYDFDDFVGPLRDIGVVQDKIYGVPFYNYALALIVRQDLFDNPDVQAAYEERYGKPLAVPTTLEDYLEVSKFFTEQGIYGAAMQPERGYKIFEEWKNWLYAAGGRLMDAQGNTVLDSPEARRALELYIEQFETSAPPGSLSWGFDDALRSVAAGEAATMMSYNWMLPTLNDPDGPAGELAGKFALYEVPGGRGVLGAWHWAIPHNAVNKDAAWEFISWLTSKEIDKQRVILGGAPTRTSVMTDQEVWEKGFGREYYETILSILEDAEPLARGKRAEEVIEVVGTELNMAVARDKTVDQAIRDAAKQVEEIVRR
ncbi:MAG: Lactose-binding protein [Firmicutes bacterium]|nr:Lactose-binding protein [Bacillota bacterium]